MTSETAAPKVCHFLRLRSVITEILGSFWTFFLHSLGEKKEKRIGFGNLLGANLQILLLTLRKEKEHIFNFGNPLGVHLNNSCCSELCQQYFPISIGPTWALESRTHHVQQVDGRRSNSRHSFTPTRHHSQARAQAGKRISSPGVNH